MDGYSSSHETLSHRILLDLSCHWCKHSRTWCHSLQLACGMFFIWKETSVCLYVTVDCWFEMWVQSISLGCLHYDYVQHSSSSVSLLSYCVQSNNQFIHVQVWCEWLFSAVDFSESIFWQVLTTLWVSGYILSVCVLCVHVCLWVKGQPQ